MDIMIKAKAFAPGHVTGFFEIQDGNKDPLKKGSRGAGVNLSLGAISEVIIENGSSVLININGKRADAPVTLKTIALLLSYCRPKPKMKIVVNTRLQLPIGQGFGMSGAGALSSSIALSHLLRNNLGITLTDNDIIVAAHCAEVFCRTGLGDVVGQSTGGWELRMKEGLPPYGKIRKLKFNIKDKLVIAVLGREILTKDILTNPKLRKIISFYGKTNIKDYMIAPSLKAFFRLSNDFSRQTGLATTQVLKAIEDARPYGMVAQSMLGNSVVALGDTETLIKILKKHGKVRTCDIGDKAVLLSY